MSTVQQLFSSGHIADLVLVVMIAEAALTLTLGRSRLGDGVLGYIGNLVAGAGLVVAFRLALTGGEWMLMAVALLVSMTGHLIDLSDRMRVRRDSRPR